MKKKGIIFGGIVAAVIIGIIGAAALMQTGSESLNLDMGRSHGTVSTAMGSPILGSESAPITIIEFGDYQCNQCYNWFHNTKPAIFENYIETGKANLVFVDLAVLGRDSLKAAAASYCAEEQGQYWDVGEIPRLQRWKRISNVQQGMSKSEVGCNDVSQQHLNDFALGNSCSIFCGSFWILGLVQGSRFTVHS